MDINSINYFQKLQIFKHIWVYLKNGQKIDVSDDIYEYNIFRKINGEEYYIDKFKVDKEEFYNIINQVRLLMSGIEVYTRYKNPEIIIDYDLNYDHRPCGYKFGKIDLMSTSYKRLPSIEEMDDLVEKINNIPVLGKSIQIQFSSSTYVVKNYETNSIHIRFCYDTTIPYEMYSDLMLHFDLMGSRCIDKWDFKLYFDNVENYYKKQMETKSAKN